MELKYTLENFKNNIDFYLRTCINLSRKNYSEIPRISDEIFGSDKQKEIFKKLKSKYDFDILKNAEEQNFIYNLYFLDIFDKYLSVDIKNSCSVLDIGSKNWYYAKSEYMFFLKNCTDFCLDGIEIDSNRLCSNLYSRKEIAKYHIKNLLNTKYICGDFLKHNKKYDYIIWILPFVTEYPHLKWGLPLKYFNPEKMLKKAYDDLNINGKILLVNQGEAEYLKQKELNAKLGLRAEYFGEIEDCFGLYKNKRYCSLIVKP